jgi:hypothetical protein
MSYDVIRLAADKLTYREKMKLAQYLIQAAIKEEEGLNPTDRLVSKSQSKKTHLEQKDKNISGQDVVEYTKERLEKSKPGKVQSLKNFIGAMFQFQGGIEDSKIEEIIYLLEKEGFLSISGSKVTYI